MNAATLSAQLHETARWADYGNDGYDRAASGAYAAYSKAARFVSAEGISLGVVVKLRDLAAAEARANDLNGFDSYNPWHAGAAKAYAKAADTIEAALA